MAAFQIRSKNHKLSNNSKLHKAKTFIHMVEEEMKSNRLSSVDDTIHYLTLHKNMTSIFTKTFYHYICTKGMFQSNQSTSHGWWGKGTKLKRNLIFPKTNLHETLPYFCKKGIRSLGRQSYRQPQRRTMRYISYLIEKKTRFYYMLPKSSKSSKKYICKATDCTNIMENI